MTSKKTINLFYSYSHEDEALRDELEKHLKLLQRQHVIDTWHDRKIESGTEWDKVINKNLDTADIILLLISADFLASDYCWDIEIQRAMQRHEEKTALVIPVLLRPCDTGNADFMKLQGLPKNLEPVTTWPNQDEAFTNITKGIRSAAENIRNAQGVDQPSEASEKKDITSSRQLLEKSDNELIETIKRNIREELDAPGAGIFRGEICCQLDKINSPGEEIKGDSTSHPAERMLSLDTHMAIDEVLYNAAMECLDRRGKKFSEAQSHRDAIKQAAQQILGWLVLSSIPYEVLHKTTQDKNLPGLYFEIPVLTEGGVEIIVSRKFQRHADFDLKPGGSSVTGNHQVSYKANLFNWQEGASVADIKRSIWNRVFKEDPRDAPLSVTETQRLNAELRSRREDEWYTEHYYLAIEGLDNPSQQHFHNICRQLLTELDELAVVSFGTEEQQKQKLFLVEFALMAAIRKFLTNINKALA